MKLNKIYTLSLMVLLLLSGCSKSFTLNIQKEYEKEKINKVFIDGEEVFPKNNQYINNNIKLGENQKEKNIEVVVIPEYYSKINKTYVVKDEPKENENKATLNIPAPTGIEIVVSFEDWEEGIEYIKIDGESVTYTKQDGKVYARKFFNDLEKNEKQIKVIVKPNINNRYEKNITLKKNTLEKENITINTFSGKRKCYVQFTGDTNSLNGINLDFLRTSEQFHIDTKNDIKVSRITKGNSSRSLIQDNQIESLKFQVSCSLDETVNISKKCYDDKQIKLDFANSNTQNITLSKDDWLHYGYVRFDYIDGDNKSITINQLTDKPFNIQKGERVSQKIELGNYSYEITSKQKYSRSETLNNCKKDDIQIINLRSPHLFSHIETLDAKELILNGGKSIVTVITKKDNISLRFISYEKRIIDNTDESIVSYELSVPTKIKIPSGTYGIQIRKNNNKWKTIYRKIDFDINKHIILDIDKKNEIIEDINADAVSLSSPIENLGTIINKIKISIDRILK